MSSKPRIMIVEDDRALNDAYKTILTFSKYEVQTAFDGQQALEVAKDFQPEIIFLDLRMPVLDGIGFLKQYQPKENHPDVTIVVFSNYDMQAEVDQAFELGAERYVLKAWASPKELVKIVQDIQNS